MMKYIPYAILSICFFVVILGVYFVGNPSQARAEKYDQQRIGDFSTLHIGLHRYHEKNKTLPVSLGDLEGYYQQHMVDPETGESYEYLFLTDNTYKICAVFATANSGEQPTHNPVRYRLVEKHEKGYYCFHRDVSKEVFEGALIHL